MSAAENFPNHHEPVLQQLAGELPASALVLDMGSGDGHNALYLAEQGHSVVCVDIEHDEVHRTAGQVRNLGGTALTNTHHVVGDFTRPMFRPAFDAVVSTRALYMLPRARQSEARFALSKMQELTKPDGLNAIVAYIGTPAEQAQTPTRTLLSYDELRRSYLFRGWQILSYEEVHAPLEPASHKPGAFLIKSVASLLARNRQPVKPVSARPSRSYMNANREIIRLDDY